MTTTTKTTKVSKIAKTGSTASRKRSTTGSATTGKEPVAKTQTETQAKGMPCYTIPAIRGIQAGKEYYVAMVPARLLPKLFPDLSTLHDRDEKAIHERYQRKLDIGRSNAISDYVLNGMVVGNHYTLSSVAASIDADFEFIPYVDGLDLGTLSIPMDADLFLFDGQHRTRGLIVASSNNSEVLDECITIVMYRHISIEINQQAFADMNGNMQKPSSSLCQAFDHRDGLATLARSVLDQCPQIKVLVDFTRTNCSGKNPKLFPFQGFVGANKILTKSTVSQVHTPEEDLKFAEMFWKALYEGIAIYREVSEQTVLASTARDQSFAVTQVAIEAMVKQAKDMRDRFPEQQEQFIERIATFNWARTNAAVVAAITKSGRMTKTPQGIEDLRSLIFD